MSIKSYLFATYKTDKRKFKIRNRTILFSVILLIIIILNSNKTEKEIEPLIIKENIEHTEEIKEPKEVDIEEIKRIVNFKEKIVYPYYIQIGKVLYLNSFQDKLNKLDLLNINYEIIENKNSSIVVVGPYDGYSKAKENIDFIKDELNIKDAFITKI